MATVLVAAGCGGGDHDPEVIGTTIPDALAVEVSATDFAFDPTNLVLDQGKPINITFRVEDGGHNLEFDAADGTPIYRFPIEEEGDAAVATITFNEPGTFVMKCTVPGHEAAGMVAQYVVL
jgi:plastocyanin